MFSGLGVGVCVSGGMKGVGDGTFRALDVSACMWGEGMGGFNVQSL